MNNDFDHIIKINRSMDTIVKGFRKLRNRYNIWQLKLMPGLLLGLIIVGGVYALIKTNIPDIFLSDNKEIILVFLFLGVILIVAMMILSVKVINNINKHRINKKR